MYSRFSQGESGRVKLPPHYSGSAFPREGTRMPPATVTEERRQMDEPLQGCQETQPSTADTMHHLQTKPFWERPSTGWGFDELLILGALLLLADAGEDREILLWLILLLFCK